MNREHQPKPPFYRSDAWLRLIAAFKLVKASLLVLAGCAALQLLNDDSAKTITRWAMELAADRHYGVIDTLLSFLLRVDHRTLELFSLGTFLYAALFFTEGFGLYYDKRWAEYLTIVTTAGLVPFEVYELTRRATAPKVAVLVVNVMIVVYLVWRLGWREEPGRARGSVTAVGEA